IWGLPSTARSLRSKQGRVIIDEAAFVDDLDELIKAALALQMWGGCIRILSTHNGDDNPFNELVKEVREGKKQYSLHRTTFDQALAQGLYPRICLVQGEVWSKEQQETWREGIISDYGEGADEELFCIPVRAGTRYFPSSLLEAVSDPTVAVIRKACEDSFTFEKEAQRVKEFGQWLTREIRDILLAHKNPVYLGEDFARSGDLTSIFCDEQVPDGRLLTFLVIELRNVPFSQQWQVITYVMDTLPNLGSAAFDSRGNGQMIAELAAQQWPGYVYQVMISTKWYAETFPGLKGCMEDRTTTIPADPFIRDDFRVVGLKAGVPCVLERSGGPRERRHGDGAISKLMAWYAAKKDAEQGYQPMTYASVTTPNPYRQGDPDSWDDE
ncbi:MAG: hypothetical protein LBL76_11010, partial [Treponema sp.]|nr:hypothetical protein [Treponema sp.]